jgi:hypothetical protein
VNTHLVTVATLALAILLSPETLVLGLVIAGDKRHPHLAALAFAVGGVLGIAFATGVGLAIAHATAGGEAHRDSWVGFGVRAVIAAVLLAIGLTRALNALRDRPIADISRPDQPPGRVRTALKRRLPAAARELAVGAELTPRQSIVRGALGGFAMCGLHPKIFPIAIAAGHQITEINSPGQRALAVVLFAAISVVPALLPAVIETARPGSTKRIKDGYERIMAVHGRWVTAVLLLAAAVFVGHSAWEKLPGR